MPRFLRFLLVGLVIPALVATVTPATIAAPTTTLVNVLPPVGMPPTAVYIVEVYPDGQPVEARASAVNAVTFIVENVGTSKDTYDFTCSTIGSETCGSVSPTGAVINPQDGIVVTVNFTAGAVGTSGTVTLHAVSRFGTGASDDGSYAVSNVTFGVAVTPDGQTTPTREFPGSYSEPFTIQNTGSASHTYTVSCSSTSPVTCTGAGPSPATLAAGALTSVTASYTVNAAGTGTLTVTATGTGSSDGGSYTVPVVSAPPAGTPAVTLRNHNGDNVDRSLCLTAGAGEAAAWQCGDLLVAHGLPGYATMGRERSLTLLYNSAQAVPRPIVTAAVNEAGVSTPTAVYAELKVNGVVRASASYTGWSAPPTVRQISLAYDASTDSSGIYPFTLRIQNQYPGGPSDSIVADTLLIVNRSKSHFGLGWHLAGVEELRLNQPGNKILWIGGDASAKVYRNVNPTTWAAAAGAYRDTLIRFDSNSVSWYRRTLRHGIQVTYDYAGRHVITKGRTGQASRFYWTTTQNRLDSIAVPPTSSRPDSNLAGTVYRLEYNSDTTLDRITDPAGRVLDATIVSKRLTQITDPDTNAYHTGYGYDPTGRMTARTTRRLHTTTFGYAKSLHLTSVTIPVGRTTGDTTTSVTTFIPWDEKGLAIGPSDQIAIDTMLAYTQIDGPRLLPIADTAEFWIDRWGAPVRTKDPLGVVTSLQRGDNSVPALVTHMQSAEGRIVKLSWNSRGNLTQTRDSTWHLADSVRLPTLVQRWHYLLDSIRQDSPDSTVDSTETGAVVTRYAYNNLGLTDSVIAPNGHVTKFFMDTVSGNVLRGILDSVVERQVASWDTVSKSDSLRDLRTKFLYNSLGNVIRTTSPSGRVDSLGRDGAQRVMNSYDPGGHRTEFVYDPLNRLLRSIQHVEGLDSGFSGPLPTQYHYAIDVMDSVIDPRGVVRTYEYDFANRRVVEIDDYGMRDATFYNRGGLVDSVRTRQFQGTATPPIRFTYDAAGRLTKKSWPLREEVNGDTITYGYDVLGRLLTATQSNRKIARAYYATGALRREVQSNVDGTGPITINYGYDRVGRRAWYRNGTTGNLAARDSIWYRYDPASGELRTIGVQWRGTGTFKDSVRFRWDALGRRDSVIYRAGTRLQFAYDPDGAMRLICSSHTGGQFPDVLDYTEYHRTVDAEGSVLRTENNPAGLNGCASDANPIIHQMTYDSRHQLLSQTDPGTSLYRYDGSGNMRVKQVVGSSDVRYFVDTLHNRLRMYYDAASMQLDDSTHVSYDSLGNRKVQQPYLNGSPSSLGGADWRQYWYDALGRTTGTTEWECSGVVEPDPGEGSQGNPPICTWNIISHRPIACRYDPLSRTFDSCQSTQPFLGYDGENVVRTEADGAHGWSFVHGPGVDDPILGYYRTGGDSLYLYFLTDGNGQQLAAADTTGRDKTNDARYLSNGGRLVGGTRFAESYSATRQSNPQMFQLSNFRNRFYDQKTGRWTQEDPIGVAGGTNLYQFNSNNPVTFSDPFGLFAVDDIYYNEYGAETRRVENDQPDKHFLEFKGETYRLDAALTAGATPYEIHTNISETNATAQSLAASAQVFSNIGEIANASMPRGKLDFKKHLPDRSLWSIGSGTLAHKHAVGNMAWGNYMARRGYSLQRSLSGAAFQGFFAGGEDPLDQRMIIRGFSLFKP